MRLERKITDYQKFQIKEFLKNGGNPIDYIPSVALDNITKKRAILTIPDDNIKTIIDRYLSATNISTSSNVYDLFTINKKSKLYAFLEYCAAAFDRPVDGMTDWDELDNAENFAIDILPTRAKRHKKESLAQAKASDKANTLAEKNAILLSNLTTYYNTPPKNRIGRIPKGYLAIKDPFNAAFEKENKNARQFEEWTDKEIKQLFINNILPSHPSCQYDLPVFTDPAHRIDAKTNFDFKRAIYMLEHGILSFDQIDKALKNDGEKDEVIHDFYYGYELKNSRPPIIPYSHDPAYNNLPYTYTDEQWNYSDIYSDNIFKPIIDNNITLLKVADKIGKRYKMGAKLLFNFDMPANARLDERATAVDNFLKMSCKKKLTNVQYNGDYDVYRQFWKEVQNLREMCDDNHITIVTNSSTISIVNKAGDTYSQDWHDLSLKLKIPYFLSVWASFNLLGNDTPDSLESKIKADTTKYELADDFNDTIFKMFDIFLLCYELGTTDENESLFYTSYSDAFDFDAVLGFGSDGYFHFKEGMGMGSFHLDNFIKPYTQFLDYYDEYEESTHHFTKRCYRNSFLDKWQYEPVDPSKYKKIKDGRYVEIDVDNDNDSN